MKKHLLIFSTILLIALTALVVVACGGSDSNKDSQGTATGVTGNPQNLLVGIWKWVDGTDTETFVFNDNNQGSWVWYSSYYNETETEQISWAYDATTKRLTVIFVDTEYGYTSRMVYEVSWFGNDQFYLNVIDGYHNNDKDFTGPYNRQGASGGNTTPTGNTQGEKLLVGTWKWTGGQEYEIITLNANHQGTWLWYSDYYKETEITTLSWNYDATTSRLTTIENDNGYIVQSAYEVMWFGDNQFYLKDIYYDYELDGPYNRQ